MTQRPQEFVAAPFMGRSEGHFSNRHPGKSSFAYFNSTSFFGR